MTETHKLFDYLAGKKGRIYVARSKSTVVFKLSNGETWFANIPSPSRVIHCGLVDAYWINTIDYETIAYIYKMYQIERDDDSSIYPVAEVLS